MITTYQFVYRLSNNFLASSIACKYKQEQNDTMFPMEGEMQSVWDSVERYCQ